MLYNNILNRCKESYKIHVISKEYYEFYNNLIMIPSMLIGCLATIVSTYVYQDSSLYLNIILVVLNALSAFLITLGNFLKLSAKVENHRICADNYDNLITKINYENEYPDQETNIFVQNIEKSILEIKKLNIYLAPSKINKITKITKINSSTELLI